MKITSSLLVVSIARESRRPVEERQRARRDLADSARVRERSLLGDDLGNAYNEASAGGWLDTLERGQAYSCEKGGRRGTTLVGGNINASRLPSAVRRKSAPCLLRPADRPPVFL